MRVTQRHETEVGTIERLVPGFLSTEFILSVRVDLERVLLEHLHTPPVHKLILERWEHLCSSIVNCCVGARISLLNLHLLKPMNRHWVAHLPCAKAQVRLLIVCHS